MSTIYLMSVICALCVANIYYNQPILMLISDSLGIRHSAIGNIPTIIQLAYAVGLLFIVPLGDKLNRKKLLQTLLLINFLASITATIFNSLMSLEIASFFIGVTSIGAQIIIPAASQYVDKKDTGKAVGILLSGLVTGILFARLCSGYIGEIWGWKAVFIFAACADLCILFVIHSKFPNNSGNSQISYKKLMQSTFLLFRSEKELRRSCLSGFLIFGSYSALWGIVAYLTSLSPFYLTSNEVGLLGLSGIAGIIASPYIGHLADKNSPGFVVAIGSIISFAGFTVMYCSTHNLMFLFISMILLDVSARHSIIGNQLRAFSLSEHARSRLNTVFMTSYFLGGSIGTKLGSNIGGTYGWTGLTLLGCSAAIIVLIANRKSLFNQKTI